MKKNNNNNDNNTRIMTKEGYNELLLKYAKLKVELTEIREEMNENILKGADEQSPSLQSLQARYNIKSGELIRISRKLENITIVNKIELSVHFIGPVSIKPITIIEITFIATFIITEISSINL